MSFTNWPLPTFRYSHILRSNQTIYVMKRLLSLICLSACSLWAWAQWDNTYQVTPNISSLPFSNALIEVTSGSQLWTASNVGTGCGNGFWLTKTDMSGNVTGSWHVNQTGWEHRAYAIEEDGGDMFVGGQMTSCSGSTYPFLMAIDNSGTFIGAVSFYGMTGGNVIDLLKTSTGNYMAVGFTQWRKGIGWDVFTVEFDGGFNMLGAYTYPIANDNIAYQAVTNTAGDVTIVGTEFQSGSSDKLFTMEVDPTGLPVGTYKDYSTSARKLRIPSICNFDSGNDFLVAAQMDVSPSNDDILVIDMDQATRTITWANTYHIDVADDPLSIFDENGDITVSYNVMDAGGMNTHHGLIFLNSGGGFNAAETYSGVNAPTMYSAIQSSSAADEYYMSSTTINNNEITLVEDGSAISSSCEVPVTTNDVSRTFAEQSQSYSEVYWLDYTTETMSVNALTGNTFDCFGAPGSSFKKAPASVAMASSNLGQVYPNFTYDMVNFKIDGSDAMVNLYGMNGQLITSKQYSTNSGEFSMSDYPSGQYVMMIKSNDVSFTSLINKL